MKKKTKKLLKLDSIIRAEREGYAYELMPTRSGKIGEQVFKDIRAMSISLNAF